MQPQQDWSYTTLTKNQKMSSNQAYQQNIHIESVKKHQGTNQAHNTVDNKKVGRMLNEDEDVNIVQPDTVSHDFKIALQQARNAKGLTQEKLAQLINEKKSVIAEYEKGTAIPSYGVIAKLEQRLGEKLPRPVPKKNKKKSL